MELNCVKKTGKAAERNKRRRYRNDEERKGRYMRNVCEQGHEGKGKEDVLGKAGNRGMWEGKEICIRKAYEQGNVRKGRKDVLGKPGKRGMWGS